MPSISEAVKPPLFVLYKWWGTWCGKFVDIACIVYMTYVLSKHTDSYPRVQVYIEGLLSIT
jgi:hypothetical protein